MKLWKVAAATAAATLFASAASADECTLTSGPPTIPDGATATEAELTAVMAQIKAYQADLETYRACLNAIIDDSENYDVDARQAALDKFNESVTAEETMAAEWSATVKAYKAQSN